MAATTRRLHRLEKVNTIIGDEASKIQKAIWPQAFTERNHNFGLKTFQSRCDGWQPMSLWEPRSISHIAFKIPNFIYVLSTAACGL